MVSSARALALTTMLALSALAGCLDPGDDITTTTAGPMPSSAPVTAYLHNISEVLPGVDFATAIVEQVKTQVEGIALDTWIVRPDIDGPVPIMLEVTPYYGGGNPVVKDPTTGQVVLQMAGAAGRLLERGYAVGLSSVRGTGNSEGCFTQGGPQEARDTAAVIEELAAMPWSNGNVGLIGVSYPGTTPQDVWVEAPPSLKTIIPISGISDMYKYNFVNGVPINIQGFGFNTYYWPMVGLAPSGLARGIQALDPLSVPGAVAGEACTDQVEVQEGGVSSTLDGNKDEYWQVRDFHAELRDSWDLNPQRASVFYIHGLQDWNVKPHMMEDWLPAIQETGVPYKVWIGQWAHNWPQREDWFNTTLVAWADQFLKEIDTGILDVPPVQVQDDDGVWRHEAQWPPLDVERRVYHLGSVEDLRTDAGTQGEVSYDDKGGRLLSNMGQDNLVTVEDQLRPGADHVLWRTEPLDENMTLSGLPRFTANITASGERASLLLTLAEQLPGGELRPFNFAALSLNHAAGLEAGTDDISGKTQSIEVRFFPQDDVVHAGSRLVLIAGAELAGPGPRPSLQPVSDGSTIVIELAGGTLELPIDHTLVYEEPQPCWEGFQRDENDERIPGTCYVIR